MPIMTAYVRYDGDYPCNVNGGTAILGFNNLGMKVIPFYGFGDVETAVNCGPEALVHGYIGDVHAALRKLNVPRPDPIDYPEALQDFLGRKIWKGFLGDVRDRPNHSVFVKPIAHKVFTGLLWTGSRQDRLRLALYGDEVACHISDPIGFISEYRCFVLDGELVGVKHYKGDWSKAPAREPVEAAVKAWKGPRAYALDFGVTDDGRTLLVEANDGYSLGCYGLQPEIYARFIEARWEELVPGVE